MFLIAVSFILACVGAHTVVAYKRGIAWDLVVLLIGVAVGYLGCAIMIWAFNEFHPDLLITSLYETASRANIAAMIVGAVVGIMGAAKTRRAIAQIQETSPSKAEAKIELAAFGKSLES
jgi:hypothetical protein